MLNANKTRGVEIEAQTANFTANLMAWRNGKSDMCRGSIDVQKTKETMYDRRQVRKLCRVVS